MSAPKPRSRLADPVAGAGPGAGLGSGVDASGLTLALRQLMAPLAGLAVARGVPFATAEELLKTAFVEAANVAHANLPSHRRVSRISTTTGINRREVSRITQAEGSTLAVRRSPATRVFTAWLSTPALRNRQGKVKPLPRQGPAPSFEALAQSVTRDVHPRSLLDELVRLGLARLEADDTVHAVRDSFVPKGDSGRMLAFLASNVGDHLRAAVGNVLAETPQHLEQAVFADELSRESAESFRDAMRAQWSVLLQGAVPALQTLIDADRAAGRPQDHRVRVGLYTFHAPMADAAVPPPLGIETGSGPARPPTPEPRTAKPRSET